MDERKRRTAWPIIVVGLLLVVLLIGAGILFLASPQTVTGTTTLLNGSRVMIEVEGSIFHGGIGMFSRNNVVSVEAHGNVIEFLGRDFVVDGSYVGRLPEEPADYQLRVTSDRVTLEKDNQVILEK